MAKNKILISGYLQSEDKQGVQGAIIQVIEKNTGRILTETVSDKNGHYKTRFHVGHLSGLSPEKRSISLKVIDGAGRTISQKENIEVHRGQVIDELVKIDREKLDNFSPATTPSERYRGPLYNQKALNVIKHAVALSYEPGSQSYNRLVNGANCPMPPMFAHDNIMEAATGVIDGNAYARKELIEILEPYAGQEVGYETTLDKIVQDGFEQSKIDEKKRISRVSNRGDLLRKFNNKNIESGREMGRLSRTSFKSLQPRSLSLDPRVGYTPIPNGGFDVGTPCLIPDDRFKTLSTAILLSAESTGHAASLMRGLEIGLCGLGRTTAIVDAAHNAIETGNNKHLVGLLRRSVRECGPDDGPAGDPFPDPKPNPGGCEPPFEKIPERCKPPVECIHGAAGKLRGVFSDGVNYDIDSVEPHEACAGTQIRITGSNFGNSGGLVCFSYSLSNAGHPGGGGTCVSADSWSNNEILVTVPSDASSGYISLRIVEKTDRICGNTVTVYRKGNSFEFEGGNTTVTLNVDAYGCVAPGENIRVSWNAKPSDAKVDISIDENGSNINSWNDKNASDSRTWSVPNYNSPKTLTITATADGHCGSDSVSETLEVNVVPDLTITGLEITQGIQTYNRTDGTPDNDLSTIANKDTIVRVYIDCDRNGFENDTLENVTGTLEVDGTTLNPINGQTPTDCNSWTGGDPFITARPSSAVDRTQTNHTLNFRIPAALANGTKRLKAQVIGPEICDEEPEDLFSMNWNWRSETSLKVRFVRIRNNNAATGPPDRPSEDEARCTVVRNFDLLPSPPTDIGPAREATFDTNHDFTTNNGQSDLLADLDDEHNCSTWEWLTQLFGSDCPNDDNAYWVGLTGPFTRGLAYRPGNTCISARYRPPAQPQGVLVRFKTAHELGHNLSFRHVNLNCNPPNVQGPFDTLPNNGILLDVPFDPFWNQAIGGNVGDLMSYNCIRWTSGDAWGRLQSEI